MARRPCPRQKYALSKVKWRARAVAGIDRLHNSLRDKDVVAAMRAVAAIRRSVSTLESSPRIGRLMSDQTGRRELLISFGSGAYVVRYFVEDETVIVVRVWHSREDRT